jgi:very-short-patch-repair endonuclease
MRSKAKTLKRARSLRTGMTPPEVRLWVRLRSRVEGRPVFRRQHAEEPFILDFYCAAARLAIEVDGAMHGVGDQPARDARRDAWLKERGIEVHRVSAMEVMIDPDTVADGVIRLAMDRIGAARRTPPPALRATSPVR